jgi:hypothetical protein
MASTATEEAFMPDYKQFFSVLTCGRQPRARKPEWQCIDCITSEGARVRKNSRHIPYPKQPTILRGVCPTEVGKHALGVSLVARDAIGRRLRNDGNVLSAAVFSYPVPREVVTASEAETETFNRWCEQTCDWADGEFEIADSIVLHSDEKFLHLHVYKTAALLPNGCLDWPAIHKGFRVKRDALEAGAIPKVAEKAYRSGLSLWQDAYWWDVSRLFGHARFGAKKAWVNRQQAHQRNALEAEMTSRRAALEADRAEFEQRMATMLADLERDRRAFEDWRVWIQAESTRLQAQEIAIAREQASRAYLKPYRDLRSAYETVLRRCEAAEAELVTLRERLTEVEETTMLRVA